MVTATLSLALALACGQSPERPPPYQPPSGYGGDDSLGGAPATECEPIPEVDESDSCDSATVNLLLRKPTLYFVLDTSGSMSERVVTGSQTKLGAAQAALRSVVEELGHRISYGLATFPGPQLSDDDREQQDIDWGCEPGQEVVPIQAGDERTCLNRPARGPVYAAFNQVLGRLSPEGKTPLAPTLDEIAPSLLRREGQTTIILLTDGHPNCGRDAQCDADECPLSGLYLECNEDFNCCSDEDASDIVLDPSSYCIDGPDSVEQIEDLRAAGIDTYVIGLLGDTDFDDVMNELAVAGGHPRSSKRAYYDVKSLDELTDVVQSIGFQVTHTCNIELSDRPPEANTLNVYFDAEVIPYGEDDGWTLKDEIVTLHGDACDELRSGDVLQVKLISGCETIIR